MAGGLPPGLDDFGPLYGELAVLGIGKGQRFDPDERTTGILEQAALIATGQLRVQSFADRRPERVDGRAPNGSGRPCGRTPASPPTATWMSMLVRSGSSRPSVFRRP
jgi:hypothetical protein